MVKKEEIVKIAQKLMNSRETIRNIGIVAHIDHGKCVSGETRLQLSSGRITKASELFKEAALKGQKIVEDSEKTVFEVSEM